MSLTTALAGRGSRSIGSGGWPAMPSEVVLTSRSAPSNACGSSDKATEGAQAENVEMPAEEAMNTADAGATPVADASGAVIIGFHVVPDEGARTMAEQRHVSGLSMPAARLVRHALAPDRGGADAALV